MPGLTLDDEHAAALQSGEHVHGAFPAHEIGVMGHEQFTRQFGIADDDLVLRPDRQVDDVAVGRT